MPASFRDGYDLWNSLESDRAARRARRLTHQLTPANCGWAIPTAADFQQLRLPWLFLHLKFELATPYTSKDDPQAENDYRVTKEWVFRQPIVRPATWKGNLRFAAREAGAAPELIEALFGPEKEADDQSEGRLHFFPTFFSGSVENEIINPHSRARRKGRDPVNFEGVPAGAAGAFCLLYAASDKDELRANCEAIANWIAAMLTRHGFGARRLKGMGLATNKALQGSWAWPPARTTGLPNNIAFSLLGQQLLRRLGD